MNLQYYSRHFLCYLTHFSKRHHLHCFLYFFAIRILRWCCCWILIFSHKYPFKNIFFSLFFWCVYYLHSVIMFLFKIIFNTYFQCSSEAASQELLLNVLICICFCIYWFLQENNQHQNLHWLWSSQTNVSSLQSMLHFQGMLREC